MQLLSPLPQSPQSPLMASLLPMIPLLSLLFHTVASTSVIEQACKATRFPDSCVSSLAHFPSLPANATPTDLILAAMSVSAQNQKTALSMVRDVLEASAGNPNRTNAAESCIEHMGYSERRLARVADVVPLGRIKDARTWVGAALLYQDGCFGGLKYVNGTKLVDDTMSFLVSLTHLTSNALSMLPAYERFGNDTSAWAPPQTERDGYWGDDAAAGWSDQGSSFSGGFPSDLPPPKAKVCKDGGDGCYRTVQEAVNAAPDNGTERFVIYIKEGVYKETVRIPFEKTNVVFLGDGMGKTIITGSLNVGMVGISTFNTATVGVDGDRFMAKGLTIENTAGPDAHQAVAFRSDSDLSVLEEVEFLGHQDTLYVHGLRQFYKSCRIAGTVDFIFGNAAAVFQDCVILVQPRQVNPEKGETNTVTAHGRTDPGQATGFVFHNCTVNGTAEYIALYRQNPKVHQTYLGRPWKEYSRTVFIGCNLGEVIRPEGWTIWSGDFALKTLFYGEFESTGPGGNATGRVAWSNQVPAAHVGIYSVRNFIQGDQWMPVSA
ncbi:hypothetical protein Taro_018493 [Colocasia esculenta]|uniref:Pectinesterase n=1 Tax=Colocasia esculenta TaxID=4460 RepID=A0A843UU13_COLES|nr:hypothetical protein [Colocasia esculenta]